MTDSLIAAYEQGNSPLSDEEYDAFYAKEGEELGTSGTVMHLRPLTSLKKVFVGEDKEPSLGGDCVRLPKLDGLALSLQYRKGILVSAATRGNGVFGQDVLDKVILAQCVPTTIDFDGELQVDGEFVCPSEFPNARNIAAGALVHIKNAQDFLSRCKEYNFAFYAYRIGVGFSKDFVEDMYFLRKLGFNTVIDEGTSNYPTDGIVVRLLNNQAFYDAGITSNCTNGGYALKTRKESVPTILLDVIWQTSPKGRVSPVGLLEPVDIDGATVSRVTLHNVNFIRKAGVRYGARVGVIRAGDIIPRIMSCEGGTEEVEIPSVCPDCGSDLEFDETYLTCVNVECPAQCSKLVSHFFSSLGVKGFGIKTSEKFGMLPAEILKLPLSSYNDIIGNTVGGKLYEQVAKLSSGIKQEDLLVAMSIPSVGKNTAAKLPSVETWPQAIAESTSIGEATKAKILLWYNTTFVDIWGAEWPLPLISTNVSSTASKGIKVCVTGKVAGYTRDSLHKRLLELGLEPVSTVSSKVSYLLCEQPSTSSSYVKAEQLNIPIVKLKDLEELFS